MGYPLDLGHNFVLADNRCNNKKRDRLPAYEHLAKWTARNAQYVSQIAERDEAVRSLRNLPRLSALHSGRTRKQKR
jgi:hypothetical protein